MQYTNYQILSAVINKWASPLIGSFVNNNISALPWLQAIQNKVKSMGWVSQNWNLMSEIAPLIENVSSNLVTPMLNQYLSKVDDASIPKLAHDVVDKAIENKELNLFEGKVIFEESDLRELKKLLNLNLPYNASDDYVVKTE